MEGISLGESHRLIISERFIKLTTDRSSISLFNTTGLCFLPACVPRDYFLVEKAKTWSEAQSYCRQKYTDLATAENQKEMDEMVDVARKYFRGHVWIGLHYEMTDWEWSLEDNSYYAAEEKEFRMWSEEPNQVGHDCISLGASGIWSAWPCSGLTRFVCSTGKKNTF
uniref:C-type lectin domain-containing protein n=1 Tax=Stegastes partitus TaxID=144197 RepID=A0A3B5B0P9_9TELE